MSVLAATGQRQGVGIWLHRHSERLRDGIGGGELEEPSASVGQEEEGGDQDDQEEGRENEDDREERCDAFAWFVWRAWVRFAHVLTVQLLTVRRRACGFGSAKGSLRLCIGSAQLSRLG
jgi:hypothetical protein